MNATYYLRWGTDSSGDPIARALFARVHGDRGHRDRELLRTGSWRDSERLGRELLGFGDGDLREASADEAFGFVETRWPAGTAARARQDLESFAESDPAGG